MYVSRTHNKRRNLVTHSHSRPSSSLYLIWSNSSLYCRLCTVYLLFTCTRVMKQTPVPNYLLKKCWQAQKRMQTQDWSFCAVYFLRPVTFNFVHGIPRLRDCFFGSSQLQRTGRCSLDGPFLLQPLLICCNSKLFACAHRFGQIDM